MALSVVITLTDAGVDTGPFALFSNLDGYLSPFETGVAKASLEAGYLSNLVPDGTDTIRVKSLSTLCSNYVDMDIEGEETTTTTSTTLTTTTTLCNAITYGASIADNITGFPTYYYSFDSGCNFKEITLTSPDSNGPNNMCLCASTEVDVRAQKLSNGGIAQDEVVIQFLLNGSDATPPVIITVGNPVNETFTYTGLVPGDDIEIVVTEG